MAPPFPLDGICAPFAVPFLAPCSTPFVPRFAVPFPAWGFVPGAGGGDGIPIAGTCASGPRGVDVVAGATGDGGPGNTVAGVNVSEVSIEPTRSAGGGSAHASFVACRYGTSSEVEPGGSGDDTRGGSLATGVATASCGASMTR